jgi:hypothetical protein
MIRISILVAALALSGCSKKDGDAGGGGAAGGGTAGGGGGGGAGKPLKLDKLGLSIDVPGETRVDDAIMGDGQMINGSSVGAMQVEIPKEEQTLEAAKEDAAMYNPKNLTDEKLEDGWVLRFENTGSMGTNHWVTVTRTIDGKTYKCWYTGGDAKQATNVLNACKTLRKS